MTEVRPFPNPFNLLFLEIAVGATSFHLHNIRRAFLVFLFVPEVCVGELQSTACFLK